MKKIRVLAALALTTGVAACGQNNNSNIMASDSENGVHYVVIGQDTVLKKTKEDSSTLKPGTEKCNVPAGTKLQLSEAPRYDVNHYIVNTAEFLNDCSFSKGYLFSKHVSKTSLGGAFSPNVKAFLDTIAFAEGTDDRYDIIFTYARFFSYADHPRDLRCSGSLCSDAAGRYQFLSTTWDNLARRLALYDFSPENQDRAAVQLIKDAGVYGKVVSISSFNEFADAAYGVSATWASMPGSPYGQPTYSASTLYSKFNTFLNRY
ncbi:MAG: glycoside hydrolase family 104 protein [Silvanigrellaceae bacterium]